MVVAVQEARLAASSSAGEGSGRAPTATGGPSLGVIPSRRSSIAPPLSGLRTEAFTPRAPAVDGVSAKPLPDPAAQRLGQRPASTQPGGRPMPAPLEPASPTPLAGRQSRRRRPTGTFGQSAASPDASQTPLGARAPITSVQPASCAYRSVLRACDAIPTNTVWDGSCRCQSPGGVVVPRGHSRLSPKRTTGVEPATFGLGSRRSTN